MACSTYLVHSGLAESKTIKQEEEKMKKVIVLLLALTIVSFTGCSRMNERLGEVRLEKTEITKDEDYILFKDKLDKGEIGEDGYIIIKDENPSSDNVPHEDKVHVTFADNKNFEISYSLDGTDSSQTIDSSCFLNPGDTITAKLIKNNKNYSLYTLSEYKIIEFDGSGNASVLSSIPAGAEETKYTIPADLVGKDISVVPFGKYEMGTLELETFYKFDGFKGIIENPGEWIVDGRDSPIIENKKVKLHPAYDYKIILKYDKDDYFFVECKPDCIKQDISNGKIEFSGPDFKSSEEMYSVELHGYLNLTVKCDEKASIQIKYAHPERISESIETYSVKKNKDWKSPKLEFGDVIVIETEGKCTIVDGDYKNMNVKKDSVGKKNKYTITAVSDSKGNTKDISVDIIDVVHVYTVELNTNCAHGTCEYKLNNKKVSGTTQVKDGQTLKLTYTITDDNYKFETESDGLGYFLPFHKQKRTVEIPINNELDNKVINPDSWFRIVKKESAK